METVAASPVDDARREGAAPPPPDAIAEGSAWPSPSALLPELLLQLMRTKSFIRSPPTKERAGERVRRTRKREDLKTETEADLKTVTARIPTPQEVGELLFAAKCAKHLKSNAIALIKERQLIGMGCGQPSRIDALKQAIEKAQAFGFDLNGAVMASDAFFPFPDCIEIAHAAGITAVIQPGGSMKDQDSIDACNERGMAMVMTGFRHFKH